MTYKEQVTALEMAQIMFPKGTIFNNYNLPGGSHSNCLSTGIFEVSDFHVYVNLTNNDWEIVFDENQGWAQVIEKKETLEEVMIDLDLRVKLMEDRQKKYGITPRQRTYLYFLLAYVIMILLLKYLH